MAARRSRTAHDHESASASARALRNIVRHVKETYHYTDTEIQRVMEGKPRAAIPCSIFSEQLSCFESIVKYLHENLHYSIKGMASTLQRSTSTIWITYRNARTKQPTPFDHLNFSTSIGLETFTDSPTTTLISTSKTTPRTATPLSAPPTTPSASTALATLTIFERVVWSLKETQGLTLHHIATITHRDDRTIWTVWKRAEKKTRAQSARGTAAARDDNDIKGGAHHD